MRNLLNGNKIRKLNQSYKLWIDNGFVAPKFPNHRNFGRFRQFRSTIFSKLDSTEIMNNSRTGPLSVCNFWFSLLIDLNCQLQLKKNYKKIRISPCANFREMLFSETGRNFAKHSLPKLTKISRNLKNSWTVPLKIVNLLIFIENRLEIGKTA